MIWEKSRPWSRENQGQEKMVTEDYIIGWHHRLNEYVSESHSAMSESLQTRGLYSPWNFPGQNTEVISISLLLGIFPTQGLNPGLPHCRWILYQMSHQGSSRILGSLSLLQWIFPTQESIWGLLHWRWILYQLSYQKTWVCAYSGR